MISNYHLGELPDGYQIYAERLEVAGLGHRRSDATSFVSGKEHSLELRRDPGNKHDKNAIEVIGCWKGLFRSKRRAIGYVPREVAAAIADGDYFDQIRPRLLKTFLGDRGFVEVLFQLIGPKERAYEFKAGLVKNPDHYSGYVDKVKYLKQQEKLDEAETLLLQLVGETEEESRRASSGVAPWYYEQLAIIYRKQKRHADELAILERYEAQRKARGVGPDKLAARLEKVRA